MAACRLLVTALLTLAFQAPLMAAPEGAIGRMVEDCQRKWLGNPGQTQYCIQQQNLDYQRVQRSGASTEIISQCESRYGGDYGMVLACVRNPPVQSSGYQRVPVSMPFLQPSTSGVCVSWLMVGNKKHCF